MKKNLVINILVSIAIVIGISIFIFPMAKDSIKENNKLTFLAYVQSLVRNTNEFEYKNPAYANSLGVDTSLSRCNPLNNYDDVDDVLYTIEFDENSNISLLKIQNSKYKYLYEYNGKKLNYVDIKLSDIVEINDDNPAYDLKRCIK